MVASLATTTETGPLMPVVTIGGSKTIMTDGFNVSGGCCGTIGNAQIKTSRQALIGANVDLMALASAAPGSLSVKISIAPAAAPTSIISAITTALGTTVTPSQQPVIFSGEYVSAHWAYDSDDVTIHARDFAGVMADQKIILASVAQSAIGVLSPGANQKPVSTINISNQNQTITAIITAIATQFNLKPAINLAGPAATNNPTIGSLYGSNDQVFAPIPQSMWAVLNRLALDLGYITYVTPDGQYLYFGVIPSANPSTGQPLPAVQLSYNQNPVPAGQFPCKDLEVTHSPRRNETFRVLVISYDPAKAQTTLGRATAIGTNLVAGSQQIQQGVWTGTNAVNIDVQLQTAKNLPIPAYTFHIDGLTQAQAQMKAVGIATDIQKRSIMIQATTDGMLNLFPGQALTLVGNPLTQTASAASSLVSSAISALTGAPSQKNQTVDNEILGANKFHVAEYHHVFSMPKNSGMGGFTTIIKAINIATQGTGNPMKPLKQQNAKS